MVESARRANRRYKYETAISHDIVLPDIQALFLRKGKARTEEISLIAAKKKILSFES